MAHPYTERQIHKTLDYIDSHEAEVTDLAEWVRVLILPHLWGQDLIELKTIEPRRPWLRRLMRWRQVLVLTPFGKRDLARYRLEKEIALRNIEEVRP